MTIRQCTTGRRPNDAKDSDDPARTSVLCQASGQCALTENFAVESDKQQESKNKINNKSILERLLVT